MPISLAGGLAAADCGCRIVPADKVLVEVLAPGCFEAIYPRAGLVCLSGIWVV